MRVIFPETSRLPSGSMTLHSTHQPMSSPGPDDSSAPSLPTPELAGLDPKELLQAGLETVPPVTLPPQPVDSPEVADRAADAPHPPTGTSAGVFCNVVLLLVARLSFIFPSHLLPDGFRGLAGMSGTSGTRPTG